jgi:hypothetical protein
VEAHRIFEVIQLAIIKRCFKCRLTRNTGLNDDILNFPHELFIVRFNNFSHVPQGVLKTSLMTCTIQNSCSIGLKFVGMLINRVVSQVHLHVCQIDFVHFIILLSGKPSQAFFRQINAERVNA